MITTKKSISRVTPKKQMSQRDTYAKAMYGATKKGGSSGIGVGGEKPVKKVVTKLPRITKK